MLRFDPSRSMGLCRLCPRGFAPACPQLRGDWLGSGLHSQVSRVIQLGLLETEGRGGPLSQHTAVTYAVLGSWGRNVLAFGDEVPPQNHMARPGPTPPAERSPEHSDRDLAESKRLKGIIQATANWT